MRALWNTRLQEVPDAPGVYLVIRESQDPPVFLPRSLAGPYKGRDPSVAIQELEAAWVDGAIILYLGKAGGSGIAQGLRSRLRKYVRSGFAERSGRWGGRLIWQLADAPELMLCWNRVIGREPKSVEAELLGAFADKYGRKPFANR